MEKDGDNVEVVVSLTEVLPLDGVFTGVEANDTRNNSNKTAVEITKRRNRSEVIIMANI